MQNCTMDVFSAASARLKPWRLSRLVQSHLARQYRILNAPATPAVYHQARSGNNLRRDQRVCFHNDVSGKEGEDGAVTSTTRQVTLHIPQPRNTDESKILSAIKEFSTLEGKNSNSKTTYGGTHPAVVILATPNYIHWLEDRADFIPKILERITSHSNGQAQDVQVVCACVDGLAPATDSLHLANGSKTAAAQEGFSILHGDCEIILPGVSSEESQISTDLPKQSAQKEASLTIQTCRREGLWDITLPLANTLFTNGRHSTLLASRWHVGVDGTVSQTEAQRSESNLRINISSAVGSVADAAMDIEPAATTPPRTHIPATPLTTAHPIGSGLGNIVRTIVYPGAEGEQPASRELEAKVLEFLKNPDVLTPTIPVWALIIPEGVVTEGMTHGKSDVNLKGKRYDALSGEDLNRDVGEWISKGAIFCRVLSGGGGWGVKAGLLSLDPEKAYNSSPDARSDPPAFLSSMALSQDITALGNIAEPGSYIQFFTAALDAGESRRLSESESQPASPPRPTAVFGTTPSTIDNIPFANPPTSGSHPADGTQEPHQQQIISLAGHFGFVSEKGMFVEHVVNSSTGGQRQGLEQVSTTKIDLPFSYFYKA